MNEARRNLDRFRRQGLCRQTAPRRHPSIRQLDATNSITVCAFTTDPTDAPQFRLAIEPSDRNGLHAPCRLMVDKITTVPKSKAGAKIGRLDDEDILRLNRAVAVFLGLAAPSKADRNASADA